MNFVVGKEYKTANGSRVRYMERSESGDNLFLVMEGGHGENGYFGYREGERYSVCDDGMLYAEKHSGAPALAGMRILRAWDGESEEGESLSEVAFKNDREKTTIRQNIFAMINNERNRQVAKFGHESKKNDGVWSLIITEEIGEWAKACLASNTEHATAEMVQVLAVGTAWLEARMAEREKKKEQSDEF